MAEVRRLRFSLRSKLLGVSLLLLALPWLGLQYIREMEVYLQRGQEQMIVSAARALALTLGEQPALFRAGGAQPSREAGLYVHPLPFEPDVHDGVLDDWRDYVQYEIVLREGSEAGYVGNRYSTFRGLGGVGDPLQVRLLAGEQDGTLYLYLRVIDQFVQPTPAREVLTLEGSDAVLLTLVSRDRVINRYRLPLDGDGEVHFWQAGEDPDAAYNYRPTTDIDGRLQWLPDGYQLELALPLALASGGLVAGVEDVDDLARNSLAARLSTGDLSLDTPAEIHLPRSEFAALLGDQQGGNYRVRVYDRSQRLLYQDGDIADAVGLVLPDTSSSQGGALLWVRQQLLHPLYDSVLRWTDEVLAEDQLFSSTVESPQVVAALAGAPQSGYRQPEADGRRTLEAAWPVLVEQQVVGALLVDQNLDGLRSLRNQALATLFDTMLAIMLVTIGALLLFAGSMSSRLRRLRDQAERSIDEQGRLTKPFVAARTNDEVGDLSRSVANMVERIGRYNQYLENLTARLSHELRTPVTVVRTSLENLRMLTNQDHEAELYIQRAEEGISRLNLILTNMSEATRLEQLLQGCEKQKVVLNELVGACVEQYRQIYPGVRFVTQLATRPVLINGSAEHLVQLLDKVVANAVEFGTPGRPIRLSCEAEHGEAVLAVSNYGPNLDPTMKDRIFDSMVSVRPEGKKSLPHLGLGLHIARLITDFHGGYIYAENLIEESGVIIVVRLPLLPV